MHMIIDNDLVHGKLGVSCWPHISRACVILWHAHRALSLYLISFKYSFIDWIWVLKFVCKILLEVSVKWVWVFSIFDSFCWRIVVGFVSVTHFSRRGSIIWWHTAAVLFTSVLGTFLTLSSSPLKHASTGHSFVGVIFLLSWVISLRSQFSPHFCCFLLYLLEW